MQKVKQEISTLYDRTIELDKNMAVGEERDKMLLKRMDELYSFFEAHDKKEMKKYDSMSDDIRATNDRISEFSKVVWIATGIFAVASFIGIDNIRLLLRG